MSRLFQRIDTSIVNQLGNIVVSILGCLLLERERHSQDGLVELFLNK